MGHSLRGGPSRKILEKFAHKYIYIFLNMCVCIYIYKTIRYSNMWWQLKLYTVHAAEKMKDRNSSKTQRS